MINILILNYGCKLNILKTMIRNEYDINEYENNLSLYKLLKFDGLIISNGPGDCKKYIKFKNLIYFFLIRKIPIICICLGHQMLSLFYSFKIFKLKQGHHGCNHPILNFKKKKIFIISQNHNFNIKKNNNKNFIYNLKSSFDNTLQNFNSISQPFLSFQGHPEGGSGPNDYEFFFNFFKKNYE